MLCYHPRQVCFLTRLNADVKSMWDHRENVVFRHSRQYKNANQGSQCNWVHEKHLNTIIGKKWIFFPCKYPINLLIDIISFLDKLDRPWSFFKDLVDSRQENEDEPSTWHDTINEKTWRPDHCKPTITTNIMIDNNHAIGIIFHKSWREGSKLISSETCKSFLRF